VSVNSSVWLVRAVEGLQEWPVPDLAGSQHAEREITTLPFTLRPHARLPQFLARGHPSLNGCTRAALISTLTAMRF
jgi:hypothetical protein